ncbi:MAG: peptide deformylase [bacterium]|nr:peptide deformylase [bacterium]
MTIRHIKQLGDSALRCICERVAESELNSPDLLTLIEDMHDTLIDFQNTHKTGRGIAAPQIGSNKRIIVIETPQFSLTLINPTIISNSSDKFMVWDSCFSYWGIVFEVQRAREVIVSYCATDGSSHLLRATDDLAELIQHEVEHLDGVLAIDHLVAPGTMLTHSEYQKGLNHFDCRN